MVEGECERTQFKKIYIREREYKKEKERFIYKAVLHFFRVSKSGVIVPDLSAVLRKNATVSAVDFSFFLLVIFEI